MREKKAVLRGSQSALSADQGDGADISRRIREAMGPMTPASLARATGIKPQTLDNYLKGGMPGADKVVKIAQVLDVPVEWLVTGQVTRPSNVMIAAEMADWVVVPHYRLAEFTESAKPDPIESVPLRKDWLNRNARSSTNLWLTELPSTIEGVGEEGDTILCRDAETHYQEGVYLYFFDGMPMVRKVSGPTPGQFGENTTPWLAQVEENPGLRLVARVLGTIKLRPV
jgi:transcriptional regulator with XRE-family HTH domain